MQYYGYQHYNQNWRPPPHATNCPLLIAASHPLMAPPYFPALSPPIPTASATGSARSSTSAPLPGLTNAYSA